MEIPKEEMENHIRLHNKLCDNVKEFAELKRQLWELESKAIGLTYRNVNIKLLEYIHQKYEPKDVLNCYGDIFVILEKHKHTYIGRRILWDLSLSDEKYIIEELDDIDENDDIVDPDYKVSVLLENGG